MRYKTLRFVSSLVRWMGYIAVVCGVVVLVLALVDLGAIGFLPGGYLIVGGVGWIAFGELIMVFLDIENNTRDISEAVRPQGRGPDAPATGESSEADPRPESEESSEPDGAPESDAPFENEWWREGE